MAGTLRDRKAATESAVVDDSEPDALEMRYGKAGAWHLRHLRASVQNDLLAQVIDEVERDALEAAQRGD